MSLTPPSRRRGSPFGRRQTWPAAHAGLCVVLVVAIAGSLIALRVTQQESERMARIDRSLQHVSHVRASTDEVGRAARRYVLSGDVEDKQLVGAIAAELRSNREGSGSLLSLGEVLAVDTAVDHYVADVTRAMDDFDEDFLTRLDRFEVALLDARNELGVVLDRSVARRHREREDSLASRTVARLASWATAAACVAALLLALALVIHADRRRGEPRPSENGADNAATPMKREPHDAIVLVDHAIADRRLDALARHVRLRNDGRGAASVLADRDRVGYLLDTLLEMAIVRSRPGDEVAVHVAAGEEEVRIAVIDSGQRSRAQGTELRLELCRSIVESQRGRFDVQSSVTGITSWFTLPRATPRG